MDILDNLVGEVPEEHGDSLSSPGGGHQPSRQRLSHGLDDPAATSELVVSSLSLSTTSRDSLVTDESCETSLSHADVGFQRFGPDLSADDEFFRLYDRQRYGFEDEPVVLAYRHHGGSGVVYVATQSENPDLPRRMAFKRSRKSDGIVTLKHEFAVGVQLHRLSISMVEDKHESFVPEYYGYRVSEDGTFGILMEFWQYGNVKRWLREVDAKEQDETYSVSWNRRRFNALARMCECLEFLHRSQFVHLDVKPENFVVGDFGIIKVVDFGTSTPEASIHEITYDTGSANFVRPWSNPSMNRDVFSIGMSAVDMFNRHNSSGTGHWNVLGFEVPNFPVALASMIQECLQPESDLRPSISVLGAEFRKHASPTLWRRGKVAIRDEFWLKDSFFEDQIPLSPYTDNTKATWAKNPPLTVFLKISRHPRDEDVDFTQRLARFTHRNLCNCYGCFMVEGSESGLIREAQYLVAVFEWCEWNAREFVEERIKRNRWNDPNLKIKFLHQLSQGLRYLHEAYDDPVIHQDVKPQNILVKKLNLEDEDGGILDDEFIVKLGDLQNARFLSTLDIQTCVFTPGYAMPIRTALNDEVAWDAFSFAISAFEVWTGVQTVDPKDPMAASAALFQGERPDLDLCEAMPESIKSLLSRCWDSNASERPVFREIVEVLSGSEADLEVEGEE